MRQRHFTDPDIPHEPTCRRITRGKISALGQLARGKMRRFRLAHTRQGREYIRRMTVLRRGECLRCGACCRLLHRCPFLKTDNGLAVCIIHTQRPFNCSIFPVDWRDLADRDQVAPHAPCGYSFPKEMRMRRP
jgi:hypothetical protein